MDNTDKKTNDSAATVGRDLGDAAQEVKATGREVGKDVKDTAKVVAEDVRGVAKETGSYLGQQFRSLREDVKAQATSGAKEGQQKLASQVKGFATVFTRAGEQFREENHSHLAEYSEKLGERVQHLADYVEGRDLGEMMHDLEAYGRRQPLVFLGLSLGLGLLAARLLKSSRSSERR